MSDASYHRVSEDNHSDYSSSYSFWTWFIAALAIIAMLWSWHHDKWPNTACCGAATPFSFVAGSNSDFESTGDSNIGWLTNIPALEDWLSNGSDWRVEGDANNVTLTGTVDSEAIKAEKGQQAQGFFGANVTVDNQLLVVEKLPAVEATPEPVVEPIKMEASKPDTVRIYFDTGYHAFPADSESKLAPIVESANANPTAKVIVSGFHDPRGNKAMNIELSKKRAKSVALQLESAGISADRIELREPQNVEASGDYQEARRAEISIE